MAQGDVPLFMDKLTWSQLSQLVLRWSFTSQKTSLLKKAPSALKHVRSLGDIKRYAIMGWVYAKLKAKYFFKK